MSSWQDSNPPTRLRPVVCTDFWFSPSLLMLCRFYVSSLFFSVFLCFCCSASVFAFSSFSSWWFGLLWLLSLLFFRLFGSCLSSFGSSVDSALVVVCTSCCSFFFLCVLLFLFSYVASAVFTHSRCSIVFCLFFFCLPTSADFLFICHLFSPAVHACIILHLFGLNCCHCCRETKKGWMKQLDNKNAMKTRKRRRERERERERGRERERYIYI